MLGRGVPAGLTVVLPACRLTLCEASLEGGLASLREHSKWTRLETNDLFLKKIINHLLSGNIKPTDLKCHCQVPGIPARQTKQCNR